MKTEFPKIEINSFADLVGVTIGTLVVGMGFLAVCTALAFLFSLPIYLIWNWALVGAISVFNLISIYQALGIGLFIGLLKRGMTE